MPRISETDIERVKQQTDLIELVKSRGVALQPHGSKDMVGNCPFHEDDKPSFIVSPQKGLYHCMGCGAAGNAIQFVQKFDGLSFRHAFEILNAGPVAAAPPSFGPPLKTSTVRRLACPFDPTAEDAALMRQVVDYYHERLLKSPDALNYLRGRGLYHEEAIEHFRLGFSDRSLGIRIPDSNRRDGNATRTRLQNMGLFRESGHEHFAGSVVLPIFTAAGAIGEMYGRKISPTLRTGTPLHLFLPGPHAGIWNAEALDTGDLILCEAPFDALTFWVHGLRHVTFIYGTEGFTAELFDAIISKKVRRVRIAYDADEAGNRAAIRDHARLTAAGVECLRVKFPWGMDANEYAQKVQSPKLSLTLQVNTAQPIETATPFVMPPAAYVHAHTPLPHRLVSPEPGEGGSVHAEAGAPSSLAADLVAKELAAPKPAAKKEAAPSVQDAPPIVVPVPLVSSVLPLRPPLPLPPPMPLLPPLPPGLTPRELPAVAPAQLEARGEYVFLKLGPREYRVGGLDKNNSLEVMKVAVRMRHGETFHLDSFDILQDSQRRRFVERAAEETGLAKDLVKQDLGKLLLALEQAQEERLARAVQSDGPQKPTMTEQERAEALAFLKAPDLIENIGAAFETCGLVGEEANRLAAYLACTSRKLDKPLAVIIQSTSAAGKSTLMEAVLAMFPEEERVKYSAMTGQSLYYLGECDLQHKVLAIVEEEGAEKASYALKLLQSEGELTIASTGKDPTTGRMETQEYHVQGPVMIFLTTTAVDIDEELQNRCLTLTVDESKEQTGRIHTLQRKARTLEGLRMKKRKTALLALLRNVQRLLQPLDVLNPYADELTFTADRTRTRRDHEKYLTLIDTIALLHQHQRPTERDEEGGDFVRVTLDDIALANRLAPELLGRSLDELPPQTRRVFDTVRVIVRERCEGESIEQQVAFFSRRVLRRRLGWSLTQVRFHLDRLRELEYIAIRYGRPGAEFQYELLSDCNEAAAVDSIGLLDVEKLRTAAKHSSEDARTAAKHTSADIPVRLTTWRENLQPGGGVADGTPPGSTPCETGA